MITATPLEIPDVLLLEPQVFEDERGLFYESFNAADFARATGFAVEFVQDNHSQSQRSVLRGLHYQLIHPQGKLLRVTSGRVFDVAVDLRLGSPTFGSWIGIELSAEVRNQLWIPPGFAHGFLTLSERADLLYKVTDYREAEHERAIVWNDPDLAITWPLDGAVPIVSQRDGAAPSFAEADLPVTF